MSFDGFLDAHLLFRKKPSVETNEINLICRKGHGDFFLDHAADKEFRGNLKYWGHDTKVYFTYA
ncbi:hypothetical protein AD932_00950 [Gluconobacter oxydans]|nr:hypothetical protein AD932_00950 [Gluconobacter oxydans]